MNKISDLPYPFKSRINQFSERQRMMKEVRVRELCASFKHAKTDSLFRLVMSVIAAIVFAVMLALTLAAGALFMIA